MNHGLTLGGRTMFWNSRRIGIAVIGMASWGIAAQTRAGLVNGSFETGDFTGYTQTGFLASGGPTTGGPTFQTYQTAQAGGTATPPTNGVVKSQTTAFDNDGVAGAAISPTNGNYLAFVSNETSAGNLTLTGSSISQTFTVPAGAKALSFDARLLNNDASGAFVTFDDFGGVALRQGSTILSQYNLDLDPTSAANGHVTIGTDVGGFQNSTDWLSSSLSLVGLSGQSVTLTAYSLNYGGDNSVETRLLLDNISTGIALPEPALGAMAVGVGAGILVIGRRRAPHAVRQTMH